MDLTDLINSHSVVWQTINLSADPLTDILISQSNVPTSTNRKAITYMLQINNLDAISAATGALFQIVISDVNVTRYAGVYFRYVSMTATAATFEMNLYMYGRTTITYNVSFDFGKTYAIYVEYVGGSGANKSIDVAIGPAFKYQAETKSEITQLAYTYAVKGPISSAMVGDSFNNLTLYMNSFGTPNIIGDIRLYEYYLQQSVVGSTLSSPTGPYLLYHKHMTLGAHRYYYPTFYTPAEYQSFLLPPKYIFDGSAYDYTEVLNNYIEELETDVDTLNTNLIAAQNDIDTLNSKLTPNRAGFLDNLNNNQLLSIPNLSTFTPTLISYLANINNSELSNVPNFVSFFANTLNWVETIYDWLLDFFEDYETGDGWHAIMSGILSSITTIISVVNGQTSAWDIMFDSDAPTAATVNNTLTNLINSTFDYLEDLI